MNNFARLVISRLNLAIAIIGFIGLLILNPNAAKAESVALDTANDLVKVATVYQVWE